MYPDSNSSSQKMYDRALASLPGGNTRTTVFMKPYPIYAARGEGARVWDLDGREYIDLCCSHGATLLSRAQVQDGVPEMIPEIQVEATFPDGTKLVTVHHPIP